MIEETRKPGRPKRTPLHKQKAVAAEHREGYVRRYVNESYGRIEAFRAAGWVPVVGAENNTSDKKAQTESQLASVVRKVVNRDPNASNHTAILMEIPVELYEKDQEDKQRENDRIEASYDPKQQKQGGADYGSMKRTYK